MAQTRVLIVDDQAMARGYFEAVVSACPRYQVVGSLPRAEAADVFCQGNAVDLVILDVVMRDGADGLEAARRIKRACPQVKIVLVTSMPEVSYLQRAHEAQVESFWYKEHAAVPLIEVLDRTVAGESVYPDAAPAVELGQAKSTDLTAQELAVLRELTTGATNSEIADRLCISVNTVRGHVQHLLTKTGYETRTQLAVNARVSGLVIASTADK